ncbi:MAG: VUT family protein, partial [Acidimicrobiales bacterium]
VSRPAVAVLAFAVYVGSIAAANWMISHVGRAVPGAHELPVGFGLEAPSGVYLAGLTFVARDVLQRLAGARAGVAAIFAGAAFSWWLSSASLAVASAGTFLLSETCDFAVYTPLQARHFPFAVVGSGLVSDLVDSTVFLTLAGIPLSMALPGQLVGKAWLVLAGGAVAGLLRRWGPLRAPAPGRT